MTKCRGELVTKDLELQRLKKDVTIKTSQLKRMEENLCRMKDELDSKTDLGVLQFLFSYLTQSLHSLCVPLLTFSFSSPPLARPSGGSGGGAPSLRG